MLSGLKPYPAYKDSGVPWLGDVPEHWDVRPNRALFEESKASGHPEEPLLSVTISRGVIEQSDLLSDTSKKDSSNLDRSKYKLVLPGEIAYNKMRAWQGAIGLSLYRGIVSPAYVVQRPRPGVSSEYMHYLMRTPAFAEEAERWSYGITSDMWSLRPEHFRMIRTCVPPLSEQRTIVRYLARMDGGIRRLIRAQQGLARLLGEQKQATIHRAVTRGLDPTVRLKPSGVAWLGDVPEHWEVVRLKKVVTRIEQGWSPQCDAQSAAEGEWGVLKVGCVNQETFDASQNKSLPTSLDPVRALEIRDGDILVSRANTRELLGLAALATKPRDKLILCDKLFRFRPKDPSVDAQFLVYAIRQQTSRAQIESSTNGASDSMQNIGQAVVGSLVLALPPFDEQVRIVEELRHRTGSAARAISLAHHGIALLREYHTHVVADVVTGKVDVREAAFLQEPEEEPTAEEETSLEEGNELGDEPDPHEAFEGVEV